MSLSIYAKTKDGTIDLTLHDTIGLLRSEAVLRDVVSAKAEHVGGHSGWITFRSVSGPSVVLRVSPHVAEAVASAFNDALAAPAPTQEAAE